MAMPDERAAPTFSPSAMGSKAFIVQRSLQASAKRFSCQKYRLRPQD
jgi:hypothetical protein